MSWKPMLLRALSVGLALGVLIATVTLWPRESAQTAGAADIWTCSMHPQIRLPNPGNCPICGMKLIPVSQLPRAQEDLEQRAGIETETVQKRELFKEIRTVGKLDYSERQVSLITARIAGRVERVFADFTGLEVKKEDHLVEIYSPELNVAQSELLLALDALDQEKAKPSSPATRGFAASRLESVKTKLRLLGILDEQIAEIEKTRKTSTNLTIYAPIGGTIIEKSVRLGQYVAAGDPLYRIADLDPIWLYLNIYESDINWVRFGQSVEVTLEAFAGEPVKGRVTFIDPFLDDATRTIRVRVNLKNPDRRMKPQMYATATIRVPLQADGSPEPTGLEGQYICPMHPEVMQAAPGKCTICGMPLEQITRQPKLPTRVSTPDPHAGHVHPAGEGSHAGGGDHGARQKSVAQPGTALDPQPGTPPAKTAAKTPSETVAETTGKTASRLVVGGDQKGELAVPVSAVLDTGRRRITYRLTKGGAYELVELQLGPRAQGVEEGGRQREYYLVLGGLQAGDKVVVQSGFLLDSQRQIEGMPSLLYPQGQTASVSGHAGHGGHAGHEGHGSAASPVEKMPAGHKH